MAGLALKVQVTCLAGTGKAGAGLQAGAQFNFPSGCVVDDKRERVLIADRVNGRVVAVDLIDPANVTAETDDKSADLLRAPADLCLDAQDSNYCYVTVAHALVRVAIAGSKARTVTCVAGTTAGGAAAAGFADGKSDGARFHTPWGVCTAPVAPHLLNDGSVAASEQPVPVVVVADRGNHRVRLYNPATGRVSTLCGDGTAANTDAAAPQGALWDPRALCYDSAHQLLYVACKGAVRTVHLRSGELRTLVLSQQLNPNGIAVVPVSLGGGLLVSDLDAHAIWHIETTGVVTRVAGAPNTPKTGGDSSVDGSGMTAQFHTPAGLCVHPLAGDGSVFVCDQNGHRIRKLVLPLPGTGLSAGGGPARVATVMGAAAGAASASASRAPTLSAGAGGGAAASEPLFARQATVQSVNDAAAAADAASKPSRGATVIRDEPDAHDHAAAAAADAPGAAAAGATKNPSHHARGPSGAAPTTSAGGVTGTTGSAPGGSANGSGAGAAKEEDEQSCRMCQAGQCIIA